MRLNCPFCGNRDVSEFVYHGDAGAGRPPGDDAGAMHDYVYIRTNPAGQHHEFWYHAGGCRSWLEVTRDTRTHVASAVKMAGKR